MPAAVGTTMMSSAALRAGESPASQHTTSASRPPPFSSCTDAPGCQPAPARKPQVQLASSLYAGTLEACCKRAHARTTWTSDAWCHLLCGAGTERGLRGRSAGLAACCAQGP